LPCFLLSNMVHPGVNTTSVRIHWSQVCQFCWPCMRSSLSSPLFLILSLHIIYNYPAALCCIHIQILVWRETFLNEGSRNYTLIIKLVLYFFHLCIDVSNIIVARLTSKFIVVLWYKRRNFTQIFQMYLYVHSFYWFIGYLYQTDECRFHVTTMSLFYIIERRHLRKKPSFYLRVCNHANSEDPSALVWHPSQNFLQPSWIISSRKWKCYLNEWYIFVNFSLLLHYSSCLCSLHNFQYWIRNIWTPGVLYDNTMCIDIETLLACL
jgi:hypothetical protein